MIYAQIHRGQRMHLAYEAGEGRDPKAMIPAGRISTPLCERKVPEQGYRMTCNVPLANACKNCLCIDRARHGGAK